MSGADRQRREDQGLLFDVATVWREERVSCPHPDILNAHLAGALDANASEFVAFHLTESECPYCNAVVEDLQATDVPQESGLEAARDRLLRSTMVELRRATGG